MRELEKRRLQKL